MFGFLIKFSSIIVSSSNTMTAAKQSIIILINDMTVKGESFFRKSTLPPKDVKPQVPPCFCKGGSCLVEETQSEEESAYKYFRTFEMHSSTCFSLLPSPLMYQYTIFNDYGNYKSNSTFGHYYIPSCSECMQLMKSRDGSPA